MIIRQKGDRRFNLPVEFPLMDSQGLFVIKDRRQLYDRRKAKDDPNELMRILSEMADNLSIEQIIVIRPRQMLDDYPVS